jgi:hypothetical protein
MPSSGDLFFDIDGDPFVGESGLEYLLGVGWIEPGGEFGFWAHDGNEEKESFEAFMDFVGERQPPTRTCISTTTPHCRLHPVQRFEPHDHRAGMGADRPAAAFESVRRKGCARQLLQFASGNSLAPKGHRMKHPLDTAGKANFRRSLVRLARDGKFKGRVAKD